MQQCCILSPYVYGYRMIIGFLGKGGSGKSTLAAQLAQEALAKGLSVLAIDADHNMDLSYALAKKELPPPYLGDAFWEIRHLFGLEDTEAFSATTASPQQFTLSPVDPFTARYLHHISPTLSLMLTGPQTDEVLQGKRCSHSLASALKLYLPYLTLNENELVIVDEKASVDAVSTGIPTGFDLAVIVIEPRPQSIRVGAQIAELLSRYEVPYVYVLNKDTGEDAGHPDVHTRISVGGTESLFSLYDAALQVSIPNETRRTRSEKKFAGMRT